MASPLSLTHTPDWFRSPERGCANPPEGVTWFEPDQVTPRLSMRYDSTPAKRICRNCPFRISCLEYALEHDQRFGVWGGADERQRRAIVKCRSGTCNKKCKHQDRVRRRS